MVFVSINITWVNSTMRSTVMGWNGLQLILNEIFIKYSRPIHTTTLTRQNKQMKHCVVIIIYCLYSMVKMYTKKDPLETL